MAASVAALSTVGISSAVLDLDISVAESLAKASVCDVTDQTACEATVDEVVRELGGVDVLVNLAAGVRHDDADDRAHRR